MSNPKIKLSQQKVESLNENGFYPDSVIPGLYLRIRNKSGSFYFRRSIKGKRYDINLGTRDKVKFLDARKKAMMFSMLEDSEFLEATNQKKKNVLS